jgi:hypothetical protein
MYCPGCGQQVTAETNFCPRCGFYFGVLRELIATGGAPLASQDPAQRKQPSERQKGIRLGAKLVFLSIVLLPAFFGLSILADGPAPLLLPFTVFLTGVIWMLYARLFREPDPEAQPRMGRAVGAPRRPAMLPASPDSIEAGAASTITTGEIMRPSVTEHTTNFLEPK